MYGCKPFNTQAVCVKEEVNGYEISMAFDDITGKQDKLERGDIRVYSVSGDIDITEFISSSTIQANIENLMMVYEWCKSN